MVSNPSSSTVPYESSIDAAGLAKLIRDESCPLCVMDCRADGSDIKRATRVRLPHLMQRRIQTGSKSILDLSPLLAIPGIPVVVLPENEDGSGQMAATIRQRLSNHEFVHVFIGDVEAALAAFPDLRADSSDDSASTATSSPAMDTSEGCGGEDINWINLKALRIEPMERLAGRAREKKTHFPVQILPHLYLGNAEVANNKQYMQSLGITHIVNVTSNLPNAFEMDPHFRYKRISVDDNCSHNLSQYFPEAISFISSAAESGGRCLVHCLAGISRSVTICIAYLMTMRRCTLEDAYDEVLRCNASIAPNFHFMGQLSEYERHLGINAQTPRTSSGLLPPPPLSPSCGIQAAHSGVHTPQSLCPPSACLTPPPTSCSASPHSNSSHSAKSFAD